MYGNTPATALYPPPLGSRQVTEAHRSPVFVVVDIENVALVFGAGARVVRMLALGG